eukprot:Clim_evm4s210 gene=Clim_evmTU4s210
MSAFRSFLTAVDPRVVAVVVIVITIYYLSRRGSQQKLNEDTQNGKYKLPPMAKGGLPVLGHAVQFGTDPINFLTKCYVEYGEVFSINLLGKTCTYLVGPKPAPIFFASKNDDLNAEDVYANLTVPVFGPGVAYDVPNNVFAEQKRLVKTGMGKARMALFPAMVAEEASAYLAERWGSMLGGLEDGKFAVEEDLFEAMAEVIVLTASRCLHGKEVRAKLAQSGMAAHVLGEMDKGFTPEAWLLPPWLPLPSFYRRDVAHKRLKSLFVECLEERKRKYETEGCPDGVPDLGGAETSDDGDPNVDVVDALLYVKYRDGTKLQVDEAAGMLIALLLAGQHTSSTTISWLLYHLALLPDLQEELYKEQEEVYRRFKEADTGTPFGVDQLEEMDLLGSCLKETLRMHPPLMTMMRTVRTPQVYNDMVVPRDHCICVSPTVNHRLPDGRWVDTDTFNGHRFMATSHTKSLSEGGGYEYVPFGAGRHRCIGEQFATVQIKTVVSVILREYEITADKFPETDYTTMIHIPKHPREVRLRRRDQKKFAVGAA